MSLEKVIWQIRLSTQEQVGQILGSANDKVNIINQSTQIESTCLCDDLAIKTKRKIKEMKYREHSVADLTARKERMRVRKHTMDKVLALASEIIEKEDGTHRSRALKMLLARAREELGPEGKIRPAKQDRPALAKLEGQEHDRDISALGGFLAQSANGKLVLDLRFDKILEDIWKDSQSEVADLLFGQSSIGSRAHLAPDNELSPDDDIDPAKVIGPAGNTPTRKAQVLEAPKNDSGGGA